jgi:hypothetical protein
MSMILASFERLGQFIIEFEETIRNDSSDPPTRDSFKFCVALSDSHLLRCLEADRSLVNWTRTYCPPFQLPLYSG